MQKNFYDPNTLLQLFNALSLSKVKYLLRSISNIPEGYRYLPQYN